MEKYMSNRSIIEALNAEWNNVLNSGNIKDLSNLYAENAILSPGNGKTLVGRPEIEDLFNGFILGGVHNHTLEIVEVGRSGNAIYQIAKWNAQGAQANGETPSFGGITTSVYEQSNDGKWLAITHVWNLTQ
jgi:uncharacterized protein (TIGR02246 family)